MVRFGLCFCYCTIVFGVLRGHSLAGDLVRVEMVKVEVVDFIPVEVSGDMRIVCLTGGEPPLRPR